MHCTWIGYIRNCTEDPNHRFLANRWLVHNWFVGLSNSLEVIVHHLLIRGMVGIGYQDKFPIVRAPVSIVTHWTGSTMSHDLRLSSSYDFTKLLHCIVSQPLENIEFVLKLVVTLTYGWDWKLIIYSLWIESLLVKVGSKRYSQ